ncbi:MAG: HEAT repeat domain-containing protein [Sedimentisphaerales bacterium]|nr:HEAT repeat domain-containing protein [Sedimentisphaerales bacterium]
MAHCNRLKILALIFLLIKSSWFIQNIQAQEIASEASTKIDVMLKVVLSEDTPLELRLANAKLLLQDPEAHPALLDVLNLPDNGNHTVAKRIIAQAIATLKNGDYPSPEGKIHLPLTFIEPLSNALMSENVELASWSAKALVRCHGAVAEKLSDMARDSNQILTHRLAAINALALIPGRDSVLALAEILNDNQPQVQNQAARGLAQMLYLPEPLDITMFQERILPQVREMNQERFLLWQVDRKEAYIQNLNDQISQYKQKVTFWQKKYFDAKNEQFNLLPDSREKLNFLNKFLTDSSENLLRVWALQKIAAWSDTAYVRSGEITDDLIELLIPLINDPDKQIRALSAVSLGKLNFDKASSASVALLEQLQKEEDPHVQAMIMSTLGTFGYAPTLDVALKILDSTDSTEVVIYATRAIGRICAAQPKTIPAEQIQKIAVQLPKVYSRFYESEEICSEIIQTMRRIAEQEEFRKQAEKDFRDILIKSLDDPRVQVRSQGVYACTRLLRRDVLPLLLTEPRNMLNDEETTVRFAVILAAETFGGPNQLDLLRERLLIETDRSIAQRIEETLQTILSSMNFKQIYQYALRYQNSSGEIEQKLLQDTIRILWDNISQARSAGESIDPEIELFALSHLAETAEIKNQPDQALKWYQNLLKLSLPQAQKDGFREKFLSLTLNQPDSDKLVSAETELKELLPHKPAALELIRQSCEKLKITDQQELLIRARIIAALISPLPSSKYPNIESERFWKSQISAITSALISQQEKLLAETGKVDQDCIHLIQQLDARLNQFPFDTEPEKQKEALIKFRQILDLPMASPPAEKPEADLPKAPEPKPDKTDNNTDENVVKPVESSTNPRAN